MIYITVPNMNDSVSDITLDGIKYKLRFTYNEKYDLWSFGVKDEFGNDLVAMTRIVPNFPLLYSYTYPSLPNGTFGCVSDLENIGKDAFKDNKAKFVYISNSEVA